MLNVLMEKRKELVEEKKPTKERYNWRYENSISNGKKIEIDGDYSQWRINNILATYEGLPLVVNEVNIYHSITNQMHYDYLHGFIRKQKRWSKAESKEEKNKREAKEALISLISEYYKYNNVRAKEALKILTHEQIEFIKEKLNKGEIK